MDRRTKEAVRYLGYGKHAIDERTLELIQASFDELDEICDEKFVYRIFEISIENTNVIRIGNLQITSNQLRKNLNGCTKVALLGVTLGTSVDLLMKKYSITDMSKAVVLQACAAAKLEECCDDIEEHLAQSLEKGQYLRPRFSPGYGDFSVLHQKEILQMLETPKKIGLTMTEASMLIPTKSVTAVIGIGDEPVGCDEEGCINCERKDCNYRRD